MNSQHLDNIFYFIDKGGEVVYLDGNLLDHSEYPKITIHQVKKVLEKFNLKAVMDFTDLYNYYGKTIEIVVDLRDKEGFWDDERKDEKTLEDFRARVELIGFHVLKPLNEEALKIIESIMETFNLIVTYPNTQEKFETIEELVNFIKENKIQK